MKKKLMAVPLLILVTVCVVLLFGIWFIKSREDNKTADINLYYVSADGLSFREVPYSFGDIVMREEKALEALEQLKITPDIEVCQPAIPEGIHWTETSLEGTNFIIDFAPSYMTLTGTKEIFLRASVVKTIVQIEGIQTVEFKVNGTPLMALGDQPVGMMNKDLFIDEIDQNWGVNQQQSVHLYYSDESGTALLEKNTMILVENNSVPVEQLIMERLMIATAGYTCPIPEGTKVLKTSIKDEICYVDLSKEFLNPIENVSAQVTVYAVVNSLAERDNINQVQFTIEGKSVKVFKDITGFDTPFDRNLDIIKK